MALSLSHSLRPRLSNLLIERSCVAPPRRPTEAAIAAHAQKMQGMATSIMEVGVAYPVPTLRMKLDGIRPDSHYES